MVKVKYKNIPGHTGYRAGSDGSIWSCFRFKGAGYGRSCTQVISKVWKRLKGDSRKEDGRLRYTIRSDSGSYTRKYGSYFVLLSFVGDRPKGMEACHKDGNCLNDSIGNLYWGTSVQNKSDMKKHGTVLRGEKSGRSKLTEDAVREIRRIGLPLAQHAEKFGVTTTLVSLVLNRRIWNHVKD